ncbi:MAG TPA: NUDIX domain-containing protein [Bdellovibrionota bacterium]|nr:NUDIX domain-containing protein [Bdellovibrionota bacterium]
MAAAIKAQVWIRCPRSGRVLLFKTQPARGGFWQPITGSAEKGETAEEAAIRETEEESGWRPHSVEPLGYRFQFTDRRGREVAEEVFFADSHLEFEPTLDPKEHDAAEWVVLDEAAVRLTFDSNREALKRLVSRIRDGRGRA